jgi:hypothetical protein
MLSWPLDGPGHGSPPLVKLADTEACRPAKLKTTVSWHDVVTALSSRTAGVNAASAQGYPPKATIDDRNYEALSISEPLAEMALACSENHWAGRGMADCLDAVTVGI